MSRCLIVSEWYPTDANPVHGTFVRESAKAIRLHHDVAIVHTTPGPPAARPRLDISERTDDGVRTLRATWSAPRGVGGLIRQAALARCVRALARGGFRPDLVHVHIYAAAAPALMLGRLCGIPVVLSEYSSGIPLGAVSGFEARKARYAFEHADVVCPDSDALGAAILGMAPRARVRTVPNPVDGRLFHPSDPGPRTNRRRRLIAVAGLVPVKRLDVLLEALARLDLAKRDCELMVVGDGPLRPDLERQAAQLGVDDVVQFLGRRDKAEIAELMRGSDALVLSSAWESNPNVVMEAHASGLPVVATDVGGVSELVDPSNGVLVAPGDPAALAAGIDRVLEDLDSYRPAPIARRALDSFGLERVAALWNEVYGDVLAGRRLSRPRARRARTA